MIVLLDIRFPYAGGEPFLQNELNNCIEEDILIYPFSNTVESSFTGVVSENIKVRSIASKAGQPSIADMLRGMFSRQYVQDLKDIIKNGITIKKIFAALLYSAKTEMYHRLILGDLRKIIDRQSEIVFYSYWMHLQACVAARLKSDFPKSRFITRAHGYDLYEFRASSGFLPGRRMIFSKAERIFSVSEAGEKYLREKYPWAGHQKFCTSYLGTIDHGLNVQDGSCIRLVSCSNIVEVKRIDLLINALCLLDSYNLEWIHYGDGPLRKKIQELAEAKLSNRIAFRFEGYKANDELMSCYREIPIQLFINVSESEGLPVSIMEIMSFGIPVIATDVGGTNEIVEDGYNGYLVPKDISPVQLAKAIEKCLTLSEGQYNQLRKNARTTWEQKFNAKVNYPLFYRTIT